MWEVRHGFPQPRRMSSGHRRYSEQDLARVRAVLRGRARGLSLQAAIELAHDVGDEQPPSVYASLRSRYPELETQLLSKRAMLAMSHAIEDECLARAERPLLFGCFQRERFYRASESRWRELARTAEQAVVLADFGRARHPKQRTDRGPDRRLRSRRPGVGDRVRVAELRRVPRGLGAARRGRKSRPAHVRGGVDDRGARRPPGGAGVPAARRHGRTRTRSTASRSGSTRRRSPASTSCARRSSSAPGWCATQPPHSGPIPASASAASQYAHSSARAAIARRGGAPSR